MNNNFTDTKILTFDIFGTLLNLKDSMEPFLKKYLSDLNDYFEVSEIWDTWRDRQRIEQYQDNILMLGHSGYLNTCEIALKYSLDKHKLKYSSKVIDNIMNGWNYLIPFDDVVNNLIKLQKKFKLVALSNGEQWYLEHLAEKQLQFKFDNIISVELAGQFKPSPSVYRKAAQILDSHPGNLMMVASHSFDVIGAKACGYKSAYIDRYDLPIEDKGYSVDIHVQNFLQFKNLILNNKISDISDNISEKNIE
ncbi:MAG: haloacid dehalogenase type II [Dehalococcoidia bacterium]